MAKARSNDYFQLFRFRVKDIGGQMEAAAFASITIPTMSTPEVTYREGTFKYTLKQPGIPEFDNITLRKGVARRNTDFFNWIKKNIEGGEYRTDLVIHQFHGSQANPNVEEGMAKYTIKDAFIVSYKPSDDLDASSSEIAFEEIVIAFESFEVERTNQDFNLVNQ